MLKRSEIETEKLRNIAMGKRRLNMTFDSLFGAFWFLIHLVWRNKFWLILFIFSCIVSYSNGKKYNNNSVHHITFYSYNVTDSISKMDTLYYYLAFFFLTEF